MTREQALLVEMQEKIYEAHQKGTEQLQGYLETNYQWFQIAATDFALRLYNQLTEVSKCNKEKVQEGLY
jgi:hypothetical protein